MASALIVVPIIDVFVGRACLRFLDGNQPHTLVINNLKNDLFTKELAGDGWSVVWENRNLGVAASWNKGYDRVIEEGYEYLLVTSSAMLYLQGTRDLRKKLPSNPSHPLVTGFGWHCKPLPRQQLLDVGRFDEQFWPAYAEDTDYEYRSKLAGWGGGISYPVSAINLGSGHGAMRVTCNVKQMVELYELKWGGKPGEETFVTPYNR